jgi:hypothetical protein
MTGIEEKQHWIECNTVAEQPSWLLVRPLVNWGFCDPFGLFGSPLLGVVLRRCILQRLDDLTIGHVLVEWDIDACHRTPLTTLTKSTDEAHGARTPTRINSGRWWLQPSDEIARVEVVG